MENPDARNLGPAPDLEYDLAHEAGIPAGPDATPPARAGEEKNPMITVVTETEGYDGDYGYDLAHDIPGR